VSAPPAGGVRERYRSAHGRGRALAELCRLQISRVPCAVMTATALAAGTEARAVVSGLGMIGASCVVGAALNDREDVVGDRLNRRDDRPLATGALGGRDVWVVVGIASSAIVVAQFGLPQPAGLTVTAVAAFVAWASSCEPLALQRRGLVGLVALAVGYLVLPITLVLGPGRIFVLAPLAALGAGVLAHKDVRDEVGDRGAGKRTLLVRVGYRRMALAAALLGLAGLAGLGLTIGPGWWCVPAGMAVVALGMMARRGHVPALWSLARTALVVTAVVVGVHVAVD
jgi:UbiA prenyltransferase family